MSSRSPGVSELGACRRISTRSFKGRAVSGRKAIAPRMPGRCSGSFMWAMELVFLSGGNLLRQRAGLDGGFGEEDSADRIAAEHDAQADQCRDGIEHQDHEVD